MSVFFEKGNCETRTKFGTKLFLVDQDERAGQFLKCSSRLGKPFEVRARGLLRRDDDEIRCGRFQKDCEQRGAVDSFHHRI